MFLKNKSYHQDEICHMSLDTLNQNVSLVTCSFNLAHLLNMNKGDTFLIVV